MHHDVLRVTMKLGHRVCTRLFSTYLLTTSVSFLPKKFLSFRGMLLYAIVRQKKMTSTIDN